MSYDYSVRNQPTQSALNIAYKERRQDMAKKAQLNRAYEEAVKTRDENDRLGITPMAPTFRSRDEAYADVTRQKQILNDHLQSIMSIDEANKFMGRIFNQLNYIILINKFWSDIEEALKSFQGTTITASFLKAFLDRYFNTIKRMDKLQDDQLRVDPGDFEQVQSANAKSLEDSLAIHTPTDIAVATRQIIKNNYPTAAGIDVHSPAYDDQIRRFYMAEKVIPAVTRLSDQNWAAIYHYEAKLNESEQTRPEAKFTTLPEKPGFLPAKKGGKPSGPTTTTTTGMGAFTTGGRRIIIGRGIALNEHSETPYVEFGRFAIHVPSLKKHMLNLKHKKSLASINGMQKQIISSAYSDFLLDLVENKKINTKLLEQLEESDRRHFRDICRRAEIEETLGFGLRVPEDEKDEFDRFTVLRGELVAGNNSPQVLREIKGFIMKYMANGRINRRDGYELLAEIAILT